MSSVSENCLRRPDSLFVEKSKVNQEFNIHFTTLYITEGMSFSYIQSKFSNSIILLRQT